MADCNTEKVITHMKKSIVITTTAKATFSVIDTDECMIASLAFAEFRRGGVMHFFVDEDDYFVPASAVDSIKVTLLDDESE